jgi:hypothetical protein
VAPDASAWASLKSIAQQEIGCGFAVRTLFSLSIAGFVCVGRMVLIQLKLVSKNSPERFLTTRE